MNKLCIHILYSLYMLLRDFFRKFFDKRKYKLSKLGKKVTIRNVYFCGENAVFSNTSLSNCYIGMCSYVSRNCKLTNVKIGNFCSIADNVNTCNGQHPTTGFVTTFPSFYYNTSSQIGYSFHQGSPLYDTSRRPEGEKKYEIVVGSDVWIGSHALLMPGIRIGDGAVIAAGSVVTKDVLPFSIYDSFNRIEISSYGWFSFSSCHKVFPFRNTSNLRQNHSGLDQILRHFVL